MGCRLVILICIECVVVGLVMVVLVCMIWVNCLFLVICYVIGMCLGIMLLFVSSGCGVSCVYSIMLLVEGLFDVMFSVNIVLVFVVFRMCDGMSRIVGVVIVECFRIL